MADEALLDNPVWHALRGPLARFADSESNDTVVRFDPTVSIFAAVETLDARTWAALADLVGEGGSGVLFRDEVPAVLPDGWTEMFRGTLHQMIARDLPPTPDAPIVPLEDADAPEMLALAQLTEPGPFLPRTHELGDFYGVREDGRIVAMAGERFHVDGFTEISAVCTHPDARKRGLGAALTLHVAHAIRARGEEAFLHVLDDNENAARLYQTIGFEIRRTGAVVWARWGDAPDE